ncbi:histidine kinase [Rheinheimera sp. 1928-s]|uniref:sensor histidine kinase n=1 Tax=Rheinheimera sp. 1928-s TaxID=3033803 RepID=UPI00262BA927|nr:histidine kinase [Rheinheimera sp. 1928-s]MDF3127452.1 histidine kinase [Rheinheimera sp. 1928-s]
MINLYSWGQWAGWTLLYVLMALMISNRPVFVETELLYAAVLIGATGLGSHGLRLFFRNQLAQSSLTKQTVTLVAGAVVIAAFATLMLLIMVFLLSALGYGYPIPPDQRWFVIKSIGQGNFFNMLMVMLLWSALYFSMIKVRQLRQTTALLHATQLDALINQLNPHFLFNAINNIRALILEDPERARTMLATLSDMLRYNLNSEQGIKVALHQELEIVHAYIALCSIQFEHRLQYVEQIDEDCNNVLIPKLLIQLCVENAIKHGISRLTQGGEIRIRALVQHGEISIQISNPGLLQSTTQNTTGVGLKNIRQRLQLLYLGAASLWLEQQQDKVVAEIRLPLETVK